MKIRLFLVGIFLVLLLSACQAKSADEPAATQIPTPGAYPDISQTQAQDTSQDTGSVSYPAPQEGETISWDRAAYHIQDGQIAKVVTTDAPTLALVMKDGRTFYTTEPAEGALDELLKQCGDPCKSITVE